MTTDITKLRELLADCDYSAERPPDLGATYGDRELVRIWANDSDVMPVFRSLSVGDVEALGLGSLIVAAVNALPELLDRLEAAERSARTLGRTIDRWGQLIIKATDSQDIADETGDGDWEVIEERLAAMSMRLEAAEAAIERVRELHRPIGVWDECDCVDPEVGDGKHSDIDEVGVTCNKIHDVCRTCCTDDGYQTETCCFTHDHTAPGACYPCPTIRAIDGDDR
jgi:hypothetical protein